MLHLIDRIKSAFQGQPRFDESLITNEWFKAHFFYATDLIHDWMGKELDLRQSKLLNFGCGDGISDLALMLRYGAQRIHGVDIRQEFKKLPKIAREQLHLQRLPKGLSFENIQPSQSLAGKHQVDGIMSWSTFEHVQRDQVLPIARDLFQCLRPGGVFFLQIEPLYYSAWGAHLRRYIDTPWVHLLVSEEELWQRIQAYEGELDMGEVDYGFDDFGVDGYKRFVFKEYQHLNRLTADELIALMQEAGFEVVRQQKNHMQDMPPLPLLEHYPQEVLTNNEILLLLRRPGA
ncbi:class I SAM-dependent methyltransferase [Lampropedia puyangensis]|uniref:Class I SAM-dependent methyltransferase n=1 Tax=Lampropedia puyangensis TaxID=1330072 RepID=A0A4S8FFV4_9BURK|nr:class I SAM-dependent methyltransferase [Lampropedia puyangensis]THU05394.1 class I SAM-dependent methyltransferase [Lampropedia puyangensis]